jgi:hypothetical protein
MIMSLMVALPLLLTNWLLMPVVNRGVNAVLHGRNTF